MSSKNDNTTENIAQRILPDVDTSIWGRELGKGFTARQIIMMAPGLLIMLSAFIMLVLSGFGIAFVVFGMGSFVMFAGYYYALTSRRASPKSKLYSTIRYYIRQRTLPWSLTQVSRNSLHGLKAIYHEGFAEMDDGRLEFPVRLEGRNIYGVPASLADDPEALESKNDLARQLGEDIDKEVNFSFKFYSTSRPESSDEIASPFESRGRATRGYDNQFVPQILSRVGSWLRDDTYDWDANEWRHYAVVVVNPSEGSVLDYDEERETPLETIVRVINPFDSSSRVEGIHRRREMRRKLHERVQTLCRDVFGGIEGVTANPITADEHACLLLSYWTDEQYEVDDELHLAHKRSITGPSIYPDGRAFDTDSGIESERDDDPVGNQLAKDRLFGPETPGRRGEPQPAYADGGDGDVVSGRTNAFDASYVDEGMGFVQVGDQYVKTFWIEEWPAFPESMCFEELFSIQGVDVDTCFHFEPEHKRTVKTETRRTSDHLEGEAGMGRTTSSEASDHYDTKEVFDDFEEALEEGAESWRINGYVSVRVGPEKVVEELANIPQDEYDFDSLDAALMHTLIKETGKVRRVLMSGPEHLSPKVEQKDQLAAFKSCGPNSRDVLNETKPDDLTARCPGGAIGAMFPMCTASIFEPGGLDFGRNQHNGRLMRVDPFNRGSAPHMITIGKSRSGKTYGATKSAGRWYLYQFGDEDDEVDDETPDRTLIVCDTQSGFDGLTKACGGEHIVIDGSSTINPLEMHPVPEHLLDASGGDIDPFRQQLDSQVAFFVGILESQGVVNPSQFTSTLEEVLVHTYARYGIYPGRPETLNNEMPTVEDMIEVLQDMGNNPERFSFSNAEWETAPKVEHAARLLDKLSGFRKDEDGDARSGKYSHFVGESDINIMSDDVSMVYLDLNQFQNADNAEKAAMLQLMLTLVSNKIRTTEGEKIFMIDEAHFLLHSDEMSAWLQSAAREWARYDACLWFISQHPDEFATIGDETDSDEDEILGQVSGIQVYYTPRVKDEVWHALGLNETLVGEIGSLEPGKSGKGYSECLMSFDDYQSWFPIRVEASPYEDWWLNYAPRKHGDFDTYMSQFDPAIYSDQANA